MSAPIILDVFGGQGGAGEGYRRAGWQVFAVDLSEKALGYNRPSTGTYCGDALVALQTLLDGGKLAFSDGTLLSLWDIDAIHTSPPCQGYTIATAGNPSARAKHVRLIAATRALLQQTGKPWVIENVEQAKKQMENPVMLCGRQFGLEAIDEDGEWLTLDRHRLFESNVPLTAPAHPKHDTSVLVGGVYGGSRRASRRCPRDKKGRIECKGLPCDHETYATLAPRDRYAAKHERGGGYVPRSLQVQQTLLGINWMTVKGMEESIPPAYAAHVGQQLLDHLTLS